jgi:hypothetical protein
MSAADLTVIRYVKEATIGVTPNTPELKQLRFTGESLNYAIENTKSAEITPTRVEVDMVQTGASATGDINIEMSFDSYKDFLASLFCNNWSPASGAVQTLVNGTTLSTYTVQKHFQDMAIPQFHNYRGTAVESLTLKMEIGKIVEGNFNLISFGLDPVTGISNAQISGATFEAAPATVPMNAVSNVQDFAIDGVPYSGCISSLSFTLKNNIRAIKCIGSLPAKNMKLGTLEVTGDMVFYFSEGSNYSKFVTGAPFSFTFELVDDAGNSYALVFDRCKFETGEVVAGGKNTDVMFSAKWRGLYNAGTGRVLQLTSTAAA